ncbi:MAG: DUF3108 domain-containing protein [Alcanivoracaceae bacterium]|nr:DUF3108 domain-containing protein [Alcanivoracaceae bacterium]
MPRLLASIMLVFSCAITQAQGLEPFSVQYRLYVSKIPTTIKADLSLAAVKAHEDIYEMKLAIDSLLVSNLEHSTFRWNDCQPKTQTYVHNFRGFGKRRRYDMTFSWDPPAVHNEGPRGIKDYAISEDTLDDLTLLLKARCVLSTGDKEFRAESAYGRKLRSHRMQVIGAELVDTPAGEMNALVVQKIREDDSERETFFWVAPALDYMVVKAKHVENAALFGELIMRSYSGPSMRTDQPQ